ncbi:lactate utilization protein B [Natronoflexus pectinivorans]|uniref:L-lactate dehydrogenase complex protein LldF n=1 Tax=Natronoflexus pectinivorans TaxID=682526 RepID=A0A4R2GPI8_9BACT|nr:LUD domain-containing protein [Natronoflexus pectinivorans]TCO10958.1 L-lactate dehydrogenase complex protein LldF [Natronoflexus pectinivorans]
MFSPRYVFNSKASDVAFDLKHRNTIRYNMLKYSQSVEKGKSRFSNRTDIHEFAAVTKRNVLSNLPEYLEEFEKNAIANNIEVIWAEDSHQAISIFRNIINKYGVKSVVKTKSMTSEEVDFNEVFQKHNIECIETDLGEFIVQQAGERPYHILTPAMHKSAGDVAKLFNEKFNTDKNASAVDITLFVRKYLRKKFLNADMGLSGANFLLAKEGAVAVTENEGNGLFTFGFPKVHVVLAGIEKLLPGINELHQFWPWLALHGTGQKVTAYNSIIFGSKQPDERDGPEKMVVILLDNGRSNLYKQPHQSEALSCIRCGACLNACPIYKNVGGYTYQSVYTGPIGSVIEPHLKGFKKYGHLSFASTLCGSCYDVCPVKINLPDLLLRNRREYVEGGYDSLVNKTSMTIARELLMKPGFNRNINYKSKKMLIYLVQNYIFDGKRKFSEPKEDTFQKQWLINK